jgi:phospholipid/cholesterol/gamma-HCH transport system permease protein
MERDAWIEGNMRDGAFVLRAGGAWRIRSAAELEPALEALDPGAAKTIRIDLADVKSVDSTGAWLLLRTQREWAGRGLTVEFDNLHPEIRPLLEKVRQSTEIVPSGRKPRHRHYSYRDFARRVGESVVWVLLQARDIVGFLGLVLVTAARTLRHPSRLRVISLIDHMDRNGVTALPIVGLISFVIGVVLVYEGADLLRQYGLAQAFTVRLVTIGVMRELGILLLAIIVAGRSGSSFTAEIGTMKVHEEVDAMRTLGLDPIEILVVPRLFALLIVMPLLAFYSNFMGLLGGMVMSWPTLDITPVGFVRQFQDALYGWTFWLGLIKAPVFAVIIAVVGTFQGFRVALSADSVGRLTTVSVVESIFLVIILDSGFAVFFSFLHI